MTCSVRVQVYNPITKLVVKNLSRFRENAYGAVFKPDGKLICAGGEEANVKLFDVSTKNLLRYEFLFILKLFDFQSFNK